jgi:dynein heavy chain
MEALVADLTEKLNKLMKEFKVAMDAKEAAEKEAARCASRLDLANRLVTALGSESERWSNSIVQLGIDIELVVGDVLLASGFVSYVGPFSKTYREMIINDEFVGFFKKNNIPSSNTNNPLLILTDDAKTAVWQQQKLPSDRVSTENGAILTSSERYSLIIDPQLQGITWLKEREKNSDLQVTRLSNPKIVKTIENSLE